jgi:hypothetical protein
VVPLVVSTRRQPSCHGRRRDHQAVADADPIEFYGLLTDAANASQSSYLSHTLAGGQLDQEQRHPARPTRNPRERHRPGLINAAMGVRVTQAARDGKTSRTGARDEIASLVDLLVNDAASSSPCAACRPP